MGNYAQNCTKKRLVGFERDLNGKLGSYELTCHFLAHLCNVCSVFSRKFPETFAYVAKFQVHQKAHQNYGKICARHEVHQKMKPNTSKAHHHTSNSKAHQTVHQKYVRTSKQHIKYFDVLLMFFDVHIKFFVVLLMCFDVHIKLPKFDAQNVSKYIK